MWIRRLTHATATLSAAIGVGLLILAWRGRTTLGLWHGVTPSLWTFGSVSPRSVQVGGWRRADFDPSWIGPRVWQAGRYAAVYGRVTPASQAHTMGQELRDARGTRQWGGFGWLYGNRQWPPLDRSLVKVWVPTWAAVTATVLPAVLVGTATVLRRRRTTAGRCAGCGYDLRATPDRCPECGAAV